MNEIRQNYKTFEEGFKYYIACFMDMERDFGCYAPPNEKEKVWLEKRFKLLWEAENATIEDMELDFRYY